MGEAGLFFGCKTKQLTKDRCCQFIPLSQIWGTSLMPYSFIASVRPKPIGEVSVIVIDVDD